MTYPRRVGWEGLVYGEQYIPEGTNMRVEVDYVAMDEEDKPAADYKGYYMVYLNILDKPGPSIRHTIRPDETFVLLEPVPWPKKAKK